MVPHGKTQDLEIQKRFSDPRSQMVLKKITSTTVKDKQTNKRKKFIKNKN